MTLDGGLLTEFGISLDTTISLKSNNITSKIKLIFLSSSQKLHYVVSAHLFSQLFDTEYFFQSSNEATISLNHLIASFSSDICPLKTLGLFS